MEKEIIDTVLLMQQKGVKAVVKKLAESYPADQLLSSILHILRAGEKRYWDGAVAIIDTIGYPSNREAIPVLIDLMSDLNCPGANDAIKVLAHMDHQVVLQHFIKIMMASRDQYPFWGSLIEGICSSIARRDIEADFALGCAPTLAALLSIDSTYQLIDISFIFDVFERANPATIPYILPGLVKASNAIHNADIKLQLNRIIESIDKNTVNLYKGLLI